MQVAETIDKLSQIQARMTSHLPPLRPFLREQSLQGRRGCLVIGPRGIGKTTFLLKEAGKDRILYLSADHPLVALSSLSDIAEAAFGIGFKGLVVDEVHYAQDWSRHIKSLYDSYPDKQLWISDSNSLILRHTTGDLSRRFPKLAIPFVSFREYLSLKHDIHLPVFDPFTAPLTAFTAVTKAVNVLQLFHQYKQEGFRPLFMEGDYTEKILGIVEKTIFFDVPFFVPRIQENHLRLMKAIIGYLAGSVIPTLNIDAMASEWSVGKEKLYQLLETLEQVGLINIVRYPKDYRASGKGAKIFFADPSLYSALSGDLSNAREAFVVTVFRQLGENICASKDKRKGDFTVALEGKQLSLEVGGRNKTRKNADFVLRDECDLPGERSVPLWALGMMY